MPRPLGIWANGIGSDEMHQRESGMLLLSGKRMFVLVAILVGIGVGVGMVTFSYAEGLSYFSSDPRACMNCHIMNDEYSSWGKSSHHAAAKCVDCHLPPKGLSKFIAKAENGYHHSKGFTLQ